MPPTHHPAPISTRQNRLHDIRQRPARLHQPPDRQPVFGGDADEPRCENRLVQLVERHGHREVRGGDDGGVVVVGGFGADERGHGVVPWAASDSTPAVFPPPR